VSRDPARPLEATTVNSACSTADTLALPEPEVNTLFRLVMEHEGSDLHLKVGQPPRMRVGGTFQTLDRSPLTQQDMERLLLPLLSPRQRIILEEEGGVDFSHAVGLDEGRFRVSLFRQCGNLSLVARRVSSAIPTFDQLGLPEVIKELCRFSQGLIALAGAPGSGKSTTIAAMLDHIIQRRPWHVLTIEDPIEYTFADGKAYVSQREIGIDVRDRHEALKAAQRQGPDVILMGELCDAEMVEAALRAAQTGRLVFGTVHTSSAPDTINRILELFPPARRGTIRKALAGNLKAVIAQMLVKGIDKPRVPATEVTIINPTIRKLIEEEEDGKMPDAIKQFYQEGMIDFTESLRQLVDRGEIDKATALEWAPEPEKLKMLFKGIKVAASGIVGDSPAPAPVAAPVSATTHARQVSRPTVRRQATVRYYTRMYPNRLYRLLVVLSAEDVRKLVKHEVAQATSSEAFALRERVPIEVAPVLPGCKVYPPRREVTVSGGNSTEARFQVMALAQGGKLEDACVVIRQGGRELARVPLAVRVGKPTLAYGLAAASLMVPAVLKYLQLDLEAQAGANFSGYLQILSQVVALPWWLWTVPLLLAAGVAAWWCWPREDVFWNVELESPERS
jgi:twitching motility protein PilT